MVSAIKRDEFQTQHREMGHSNFGINLHTPGCGELLGKNLFLFTPDQLGIGNILIGAAKPEFAYSARASEEMHFWLRGARCPGAIAPGLRAGLVALIWSVGPLLVLDTASGCL